MRSVLTIARRDILGYLSAPKAAGIFWFFLLLIGWFFNSNLGKFLEYQQQAGMFGGQAPELKHLVAGTFHILQFIFLLAIPAITMAAFSEERKNHSFRLLQTAPISTVQIVLGKFFASFGILSLVLVASFAYPAFIMMNGNPDVGPILTAYLGVFLLMSAQLSFGLWVSSMTKNQFMAFLFTMFGLFFLFVLNYLADAVTSDVAGRNFVKYLAVSDHFESFLKGMITVQDVVYFGLFTAVFLFLTNTVIDSQRWR